MVHKVRIVVVSHFFQVLGSQMISIRQTMEVEESLIAKRIKQLEVEPNKTKASQEVTFALKDKEIS